MQLTRYFYFVAVTLEGCFPEQAVTLSFGVVDAASPEDARKQAEVLIVNGLPTEWLKVDEDDLDEDEVDEGPDTYAEACELLGENGHVILSHIEIIPLPLLLCGPTGDRDHGGGVFRAGPLSGTLAGFSVSPPARV